MTAITAPRASCAPVVLITISWARSSYVHLVSITIQALERVIRLGVSCWKEIRPHKMYEEQPRVLYSICEREQYELNMKDSGMFWMTIDEPLLFGQRQRRKAQMPRMKNYYASTYCLMSPGFSVFVLILSVARVLSTDLFKRIVPVDPGTAVGKLAMRQLSRSSCGATNENRVLALERMNRTALLRSLLLKLPPRFLPLYHRWFHKINHFSA